MSIRKISDLEKLEISEVYNSVSADALKQTLIEASYPRELGGKSFVSMKMLFGDVIDIIKASILSSDEKIDFNSPVAFHNDFSIYYNAQQVFSTSNGQVTIDGNIQSNGADLAEIYIADADYEPGTLVKFGGEKEITAADDVANAVVTAKPGIVINHGAADQKFAKGIALAGRTPVKCIGKVSKFDRLTLAEQPGFAKAAADEDSPAIGIALEDLPNDISGVVECVVKMSF